MSWQSIVRTNQLRIDRLARYAIERSGSRHLYDLLEEYDRRHDDEVDFEMDTDDARLAAAAACCMEKIKNARQTRLFPLPPPAPHSTLLDEIEVSAANERYKASAAEAKARAEALAEERFRKSREEQRMKTEIVDALRMASKRAINPVAFTAFADEDGPDPSHDDLVAYFLRERKAYYEFYGVLDEAIAKSREAYRREEAARAAAQRSQDARDARMTLPPGYRTEKHRGEWVVYRLDVRVHGFHTKAQANRFAVGHAARNPKINPKRKSA
jgi:hypothetical protein